MIPTICKIITKYIFKISTTPTHNVDNRMIEHVIQF